MAAEQHTLTVDAVGNGSVGLSPSGGVYAAGTPVELTAVADAGWQFSGWSGDLTGADNPATITMDGDKSVAAIFIEEAPVPTGFVGSWSFEDGGGTTAADGSGLGNDAAVVGADWTVGMEGGALSFNGAGDHVVIPNDPSLSLASNRVTLACWIYPTSLSTKWSTIIQKTNTSGGWFDWQIYARASDAPTAYRPVFRVNYDKFGEVQGDIVLSTNTWYFIAATYDGSQMKFYIDGTLRGTTNATGTIPNGGRDIWVGSNDNWSEHFAGLIDELYIYDRALSEGEIQALMNPVP